MHCVLLFVWMFLRCSAILQGLRYIADTIQSGATEKSNVNAILQNKIDDPATGKSSRRATEIQKPHVNE